MSVYYAKVTNKLLSINQSWMEWNIIFNCVFVFSVYAVALNGAHVRKATHTVYAVRLVLYNVSWLI